MSQAPSSEREPLEPTNQSKVRKAFKDHFDALVAVCISAAIFSGAYFMRIAPMLGKIDEQMAGISTQLVTVNDSIVRLETNELFRLQITSRDLMRRMDSVITQTTTVAGELAVATTSAAQVRADFAALHKALRAYETAVSAAAAPLAKPLPDLRGNADKLAARLAEADAQLGAPGKAFPKLYVQAAAVAARLDEAERRLPAGKQKFPDLLAEAEALAKRIADAQAKVEGKGKGKEFPDVGAAARDLQAELERARKSLRGAIVVCTDVKDPAFLRQMRKRGYCK